MAATGIALCGANIYVAGGHSHGIKLHRENNTSILSSSSKKYKCLKSKRTSDGVFLEGGDAEP